MCTEVFGKIIVCRFTMRHKLFFDVLEKLKCCFKKAKHAALFFFLHHYVVTFEINIEAI